MLSCENWYSVQCKRLQDDQAAGQERQFSFIEPLLETYFSDVVVKSACGLEYALHASILRLSGFECSMCTNSGTISTSKPSQNSSQIASDLSHQSPIQISVAASDTADGHGDEERQPKLLPFLNLSPIYLQPSSDFQLLTASEESGLGALRSHHFSNSFNCLSNGNTQNINERVPVDISMGLLDVEGGGMRRFTSTSNSDSHLETSQVHCKNIFNFCQDLMVQPMSSVPLSSGLVSGLTACNTRRPPLSPYRARSPSPFLSSMDTPPTSPLTPIAVLYNLPTFLLSPILHWLYTESLLPDMSEDICVQLINFSETQPSLMKLVEPTRKYLKLLRLKKCKFKITSSKYHVLIYGKII